MWKRCFWCPALIAKSNTQLALRSTLSQCFLLKIMLNIVFKIRQIISAVSSETNPYHGRIHLIRRYLIYSRRVHGGHTPSTTYTKALAIPHCQTPFQDPFKHYAANLRIPVISDTVPQYFSTTFLQLLVITLLCRCTIGPRLAKFFPSN